MDAVLALFNCDTRLCFQGHPGRYTNRMAYWAFYPESWSFRFSWDNPPNNPTIQIFKKSHYIINFHWCIELLNYFLNDWIFEFSLNIWSNPRIITKCLTKSNFKNMLRKFWEFNRILKHNFFELIQHLVKV